MSGLGKGKILRSGGEPVSKSSRAGLIFPTARVLRHMKEVAYGVRVGVGAAIYLAAVLEYLTTEVLDMAGENCVENNKHRVTPRHLIQTLRQDSDFAQISKGVVFTMEGAVLRQPAALPDIATPARKVQPVKDDIVGEANGDEDEEDEAV